jgi:RNA polymerase sigma-70 factor (ECF subfamily)
VPTDLELLDAWSAGDRAAGNELVRRHFALIYRFFRSKLDGPVDDAVQATFLACIESRERFRGQGTVRSYLLGIARFKLLQHLRSKQRYGKVFAPDRVSIRELVGEDERSPSFFVLKRGEHKLLLRALRHIPVDLQIALELRYWEEMSTEEIAEVLEIPAGTVRSRLTRARVMLKERIGQLAFSPELRKVTLDGFDRWAKSLGAAMGPASPKPE